MKKDKDKGEGADQGLEDLADRNGIKLIFDPVTGTVRYPETEDLPRAKKLATYVKNRP